MTELSITEMLTIASFMAVFAKTLVSGLVTPLFERYKWDKFWLQYVSWIVTAGIVASAQVNLFVDRVPSQAVGYILTIIACGGGSNMIHDLFDKKAQIQKLE